MRRDKRLILIGAAGGLAGALVVNFGPLDDLSAVNQWLMGVVTAGGTMWALLTGTGAWE